MLDASCVVVVLHFVHLLTSGDHDIILFLSMAFFGRGRTVFSKTFPIERAMPRMLRGRGRAWGGLD